MKWLKDLIFNVKLTYQRATKGYCDLDVWNVDAFIEDKLLKVLKEFRMTHATRPTECNSSEEWDKVLDKMISLLEEMNEDTCSLARSDKMTLHDYEEKKSHYRAQCKDEFYDLLKKWHWDLWS